MNQFKPALLLIFLLAFACSRPEEAPVFKDIKNVKIGGIRGDKILLTGDAIFYNPNRQTIRLRKSAISIEMKGKKMADLTQTHKTIIKGQEEFSVPVDALINIEDLDFLNNLFGLLEGKRVELRYYGTISISYKGLPVKIPLDHKEEVRLKLRR